MRAEVAYAANASARVLEYSMKPAVELDSLLEADVELGTGTGRTGTGTVISVCCAAELHRPGPLLSAVEISCPFLVHKESD